MFSETDLSFWDQVWIVVALMVTAIACFGAGLAVKQKEIEEEETRREIEAEAHKYATLGRQGYRNTDIAA